MLKGISYFVILCQKYVLTIFILKWIPRIIRSGVFAVIETILIFNYTDIQLKTGAL